jgi:UDP-glucose 4-epimerase
MRIALTGGSGGIGLAITNAALARGYGVVSIDRVKPVQPRRHPNLRYIQAEAADYDALVAAFADCDALVHMAAIPNPMTESNHVVHNNNVVSSYNAMRAAVECGILRICQASSVNAIGQAYSLQPRYHYFPIDEQHPSRAEDPYSLSKWICEQQADAFARRYAGISIASMRFHWVLPDRNTAMARYNDPAWSVDKHLWGYTRRDAAAEACLLGVETHLNGHEVFYIVAPDTATDTPSRALAARYFPDVPIHSAFPGRSSFMTSAKAERLLGWVHHGSPF